MKQLALMVLVACGGGGTAQTPVAKPVAHSEVPAGPPPAVDWTALVGPIKSVSVTTPDHTLAPRVKGLLASEVGKPIDRRRLRGVLTQVLALSGVADVTASATQLPDGVELVVEVVPQPLLHALTAREVGAADTRGVGAADIVTPGQLATAIGLPIDLALLDAVARQLRDQYLGRGFVDATVDWKQTPAGKGQVDITIEVTPGKASTVASLDFKGNVHAKRDDLLKALNSDLVTGTPWDLDRVERASLLVASYYYDHGYVNVTVDAPKPVGGPSPAVFTISEGDQYRVGKLEVSGVSPADAKKYLPLVGLKSKDIFSRSAIVAGVQKIADAVHAAGMTNANVLPVTKVDTAKKTIDLTLEITK